MDITQDKLHKEMLENIVRELESETGRKFKHELTRGTKIPEIGLQFGIFEVCEREFLRIFKIPYKREIAYLLRVSDTPNYSVAVFDPSVAEVIKGHVEEYCNATKRELIFLPIRTLEGLSLYSSTIVDTTEF